MRERMREKGRRQLASYPDGKLDQMAAMMKADRQIHACSPSLGGNWMAPLEIGERLRHISSRGQVLKVEEAT